MKQLLTIAAPNAEFDIATLNSRGGFVWWYTDMVDPAGNGVVLIWAFGLPFLPGYAAAARRGLGERPADRPSLNIAVMRGGALDFYLLEEFKPSDASWEGLSWRFGDSTIAAARDEGEWSLDASLDCPIPGDERLRLRGTVRLRGVARRAHEDDSGASTHNWAPLTGPAQTQVSLAVGDERYEFRGRGYFDGNVGRVPLHDAGIAQWTWGRVPTVGREAIYYLLWSDRRRPPEATGVEVDHRGVMTRFALDVDVSAWQRGNAGLRFPARLRLSRGTELWADVRTLEVLDDGPFYLRFFIEADVGAGPERGIAEFCRTDRIDLARHRPLVRMRVHRPGEHNSLWLPLFTGPRRGRLERLVRQFARR